MSETTAELFTRLRMSAGDAPEPRVTRRRVAEWEQRLVAFIAARSGVAFEWGVSDCCLFACDAIREVRGEDPATWFRGRYSDHRGAAAALREFSDGGDLEAVVEKIAAEQGFDEVPPAFAQRGDFALIETDAGKALGVFVDHRIAAQGPAALVLAADARVLRAWAV